MASFLIRRLLAVLPVLLVVSLLVFFMLRLAPGDPAAVIAGNTEVSQAACNALIGALGIMAGSQGTMNNFVWGNAEFQNYETIAGGTGGGAARRAG